jgi:hypothetical protein
MPGAPSVLTSLATVLEEAEIIGAALQFKVEGIVLSVAGEMQNEDLASRREEAISNQSGKDVAAAFSGALGTTVSFSGAEQQPRATAGQRGPAPGAQPGGRRGRRLGGEDAGGPAEGGGIGPRLGGPGGGGPGAGGPGGRRGPGGRLGRLGEGGGEGAGPQLQQRQQQQQPAASDKPTSTIQVSVPDGSAVVLLTANLIDAAANAKLFNEQISRFVLRQKGYLDMVGGEPRIHELAQAVNAYVKANQGQFPRGTAQRSMPTTRAGRPYPPDERVSWLAELLPYLGSEQASLRINKEKSWRDPENLIAASTLIPQFIDPATRPNSWWVRYPSLGEPVAATHYVGIAGIGLDAADYPANDPNLANKLGIFGYDRGAKMSDIKDGAANTILMAEVPPVFKRPWLAGGGATVVGVPEKNSFQPFISSEKGGKRGSYVIMADGSVRFIAEGISDDVFRAMCTMNGGTNDVTFVVNRDAVKVESAEQKPVAQSPVEPPPTAAQPEPKAEAVAPKIPTPGPNQQVNAGELTDILSQRCANCHTGARAKGRTMLFTAQKAPNADVRKDKILQQVQTGKMPKRPAKPLSDHEKELILNWARSE